MSPKASRGEIWLVNLNPTKGHEQAGHRPALVISNDLFNHGAAELLTVLPITTTDREIPLHVQIAPPQGGLRKPSLILCDQVRTISRERLLRTLGSISSATMREVEDRLRILLNL